MPAVSLAIASAVLDAPVRVEAANGPRFKAVAFDFLALFHPDSIVPEVERAREPLP